MGHADGIGQFDLAAAGKAGSHDILGHPAGCVGSGAVHLGGVFPGEGAAAVAAITAVGVHNDLPAGEAAIAHGAADDKPASGVDIDAGVLVH